MYRGLYGRGGLTQADHIGKRKRLINFLQKYWWVIVLIALAGWSAALAYFTIRPPETAMEREIRLRASFLEPRQAADLDEAAELLRTVSEHLRQLPRDQMEYLYIRHLLADIKKWKSPAFRKALLEQLRKARKEAAFEDVEENWIQRTMTILCLSQDDRPGDLAEAAELLEKRRKEIERENDMGFNNILDDLIDDLKHRETQNKRDLMKRANEFLAGEVVDMARERLMLAGTPALPYLVTLLEQDANENKRKHLYDVVLYIIACTRAQSPTSQDIEQITKELHKEYGEEPGAAAIAKLKDWLDSPGNRELLGR